MATTNNVNGEHTIVRTRMVYEGWTKFLVATIRFSDGHTLDREIEDHGEAACVLPFNVQRKTAVLVRQMRAPPLYAAKLKATLEAVAGVIEDEDAAACARREAREEAHLEIKAVEHVFTGWTMPGLSTERMHFFLAQYSGDVRADVIGGLADEREDTVVGEFRLADLARMADANELNDVKTLVLLQTLRLRRPELFEP
jgi:nudix-type nucleoside diphosphatase (YffH/AdpP family)